MTPFQRLKSRAKAVFQAIAKGLAWVLCVLFYFLVLGPYAIVLRIAAGDRRLLQKRRAKGQESNWHRLPPERVRPGRPF